ncbi:MAG: DUF6288 domain-containing protein [Lentisphaeria bacterium]
MRNKQQKFQLIIAAIAITAGALAVTSASAKQNVRTVTYSPHADRIDCHMNMGPTGAKAWMRGYRFQVVSIDQESPADGNLRLGDVVVAANGTTFGPDNDPRITLGNAIGKAEATGKPLKLTVYRDGGKKKVKFDLPEIGAFAPTWPDNCDKSKTILDAACRQLLNAQLPEGEVKTDGAMGTYLTGLLLLASDDPKYLDGARRAAYKTAGMNLKGMSYNNWALSYGGLLLAEYYLATGDDSVLPKLSEVADTLTKGQMKCGSWGHSSPGAGYGALNQPGIVGAITLVLAQECGIDVDREAVQKALAFFGRYAMLGCVPYGDHGPGGAPDSNGRNASAAVLMHLTGQADRAAAFSRSVAMSYWMREAGHTGGFFSFLWGPLGASLAGRDKLQTFLDYQRWYYNLCRTWEGDLVLLPYREALTRFDHSGYIYSGGDFTSGAMGLVFALPHKHLRILGAPQSVFSPGSKLTGGLLTARKHYLAREWKACDNALAAIDPSTLKTNKEKRWFEQLKSARALIKASTERTLLEIGSNLVEGAAYRASEQYKALKRRLGDTADERFTKMDKRFDQGSVAWHVREGKQYYEAWDGLRGFAVKSWVPQGSQAKHLIEGLPTLRQPIWEPLSPTSQISPQKWRSLLLKDDQTFPKGWYENDFDDSRWISYDGLFLASDAEKEKTYPKGSVAARRRFTVENPAGAKLRVRLQTVRRSDTRVYLNGKEVVRAVRGQRGGYAAIELDEATLDLLKPGKNLLAVTSTKQGGGNSHLDVGLEINRRPLEKRTLPVRRPAKIFATGKPEIDNTLRVHETKNEMKQKRQESYNQKDINTLLKELEEPVAYYRNLAENALVKKGTPGITRAIELADHPDWKVRSAVCNIVNKAWKKYHKKDESKAMAVLEEQLPMLTRMLDDEHFWVRTKAASALGEFGEQAQPAVPKLLELVQDPDEWVRTAAVQTIRTVNTNPADAITAALKILKTPGSAYGAPRTAVALLEEFPEAGQGRLDALLALLRHPPEGGGGRLLNKAMKMAAALDPDGDRLIPVLIEAATDKTHYSRQRGNPRGEAIKLLGSYGEKASEAVPVLKEILRSKDSKSQHRAAQEALTAITGEEFEADDDSEADQSSE